MHLGLAVAIVLDQMSGYAHFAVESKIAHKVLAFIMPSACHM